MIAAGGLIPPASAGNNAITPLVGKSNKNHKDISNTKKEQSVVYLYGSAYR